MEIEKQELKKFQDWQKLCNATIDPFILLDLEGNVITLNKKAAKLLDKSVDELIGWNSYDFMALNEVKFFKAQINNIARLRKPVRVEKEIFRRTFDLSISLIFDEQGKSEQIAFFLHDITERKKIEEQLIIKSKAIESSNNAIAFADIEGKLIYGNPTFLKEWGYTNINEVIGKHATTFWHKEEETSEVIKGLQNEGKWFGELVARRKNGKIFDVQVSASMVMDDFGKLICMMASSIDITERKRNEELLKESKLAYQDAYNRMLMYQGLITHDIRNVLNSVQSLAYLYNRYRNNRPKMDDVLKMIKEQIIKGDKLIRNVLKLSNLEIMKISLKPVDVLIVLEKSIKFLHDSFLNRDISVQVDSVSNEFVAQADNFLIDVFENLLNNAVKHNNNPIAEILIRITKEERGMKKYIQFEFIDNGNGIPDNRKQLVFQGSHPKKEYTKGLGIGLSLVFKIIKNYGGEIWVEDKVKGDRSKGSKFVILIPEAY